MIRKPPRKAAKPKKAGKLTSKSTAAPNVTTAPAGSDNSVTGNGRPPGLTDKAWLFCNEYLVDLNGTQAAIRSGYSAASARQIAAENLSKPDIAECIAGLLEQRVAVTKTRLVTELARIGFADIRKAVTWRPALETMELLGAQAGEEPVQVIRSRVTVIDSAEVDPDTAAAIASVSQSATGAIRVQMHNKVDALEKLARVLNHYKEPSPVNVELRPIINLIGRPAERPGSAAAPKAVARVRDAGD